MHNHRTTVDKANEFFDREIKPVLAEIYGGEMSDRIANDGDGFIFLEDGQKDLEYVYIEDTAFFGYDQNGQWNKKQYPHANILGPSEPVKYVQIDGALLVAFKCLVAEFAIGLLVLGWLIWKTH